MSLPDLIEVKPLDKPVRAVITVPGSKSITNRALVLAALGEGETTLQGALWSEDTQVMVECLQELGFMVNVAADPEEFCNRTIMVYGKGGLVPPGGTEEQPLELFVGNAGTTARFLAALVCLGQGVYRLHGVPRMHERPQAELLSALRQLGYEVESEQKNDKLPIRIVGVPPASGIKPRFDTGAGQFVGSGARSCSVSIESSSQFASALLLCAGTAGWNVKVKGENAEESPYVRMTSELIKVFPKRGGVFQIEPDASSGSYFLASGKLLESLKNLEYSEKFGVPVATSLVEPISVAHWPTSGWQVDQNFPGILLRSEALILGLALGQLPHELAGALSESPVISRARDLGDSIMTAIVVAPFSLAPVHFTDLGRLRVQECERVLALRTELAKCGAKVLEAGDKLTVFPSQLHGASIETYDDHRMAMCFAILGLKIPGIKLQNPSCVKKTFPNFFQKLAGAPPQGLGATILDGNTGQALKNNELFAGI